MSEHESRAKATRSANTRAASQEASIGKQSAVPDTAPAGEHGAPAAHGSVFKGGKLPWSGESGHDRIAAPDALEFGDIETTESRIQDVFVFNVHREPATVSVMLDAAPALQIVERPSLLRPSHEGFDPGSAIRVAYSPHDSAVHDGKLVVSLRWSDGATQTVKIKIQAAAHRRTEPTHAERASQAATARQDEEMKSTQAKIAAAHEVTVRKAEKGASGIRPPIEFGYQKLLTAAELFCSNQAAGVSDAAGKVSLYSRRQAAASVDPPIAITIIKAALEVATGRLSGLVTAGFNKLTEPRQFKQWQKGTTANVGSSVLSGFASTIGTALTSSSRFIQSRITWQPDETSGGGDPGGEAQVDFFTQQLKALNASTADRKNRLVDLERALMPLNTPELADLAREMLEALAHAFTTAAEEAVEIQAYETTRQWARFVSHASLGSVGASEAKRKGLSVGGDGGSIAKMDKALLGSQRHPGMIDLEFAADMLRPAGPIRYTSARIFGLSEASARILKLDQLPLRSAGLPMRLRATPASSPVSVTITRDEAGNVAFTDESGAVGMPTKWLSRRGHGRDDAAAYRAALALIESTESQTLRQLGVELELDDAS